MLTGCLITLLLHLPLPVKINIADGGELPALPPRSTKQS